MSDCPHDLAERETAVADGYCPLCMEAEIKRLQAYAKHERSLGAEGPMIELVSAQQEIKRLQALLHELADDLESELLGRYKTLEGKMHPVEQRRFERDMDSVRRARRALERRKE